MSHYSCEVATIVWHYSNEIVTKSCCHLLKKCQSWVAISRNTNGYSGCGDSALSHSNTCWLLFKERIKSSFQCCMCMTLSQFSSIPFPALTLFNYLSSVYFPSPGTIIRLPALLRVELFKFSAEVRCFVALLYTQEASRYSCATRRDRIGSELFLRMFDVGHILQAASL